MASHLTGQSVDRVESPRLLRGQATFVDAIRPAGTRHVAFVRSPVAHARVVSVDTTEAASLPGVVAVLTAADVDAVSHPLTVQGPPELRTAPFRPLAGDKVRFVGDPVALVVADTLAAATDGAAAVHVEYEPLPAVVDMHEAAAPDAPLVFDELGTNVVLETSETYGPVDDVFAAADRIVTRTFRQHRFGHAPLEGRGGVATWHGGRLTYDMANKRAHAVKLMLSGVLGVPFADVHVRSAPDIGGCFGSKGQTSREDVALCAAAMIVGGSVRWTEQRSENLAAAGQAREEDLTVEAAVDDDGAVRALRVAMTLDQGAYPMPPFPATMFTNLVRLLLPNALRLEAYAFEARVVATNKASYIAYRGPWAAETWVRERILDECARELGISRLEIRRRNLVTADEQPREMITGPTLEGVTARETLDRAAELMDLPGFEAEQAAARAEGRLLGLGFATFIEIAPGPPDFASRAGFDLRQETARARLEPTGDLTIHTWQTPHGQGHETTLAQVAADELGIPMGRVRLVTGDSDATPFNTISTGGSRSATMGAGSTLTATRAVKEKVLAIAADALEAAEADLVIEDGVVSVAGTPSRSVTLDEVAQRAWFAPSSLPADLTPGIDETRSFGTPRGGWACATHVCWVEIDPDTGLVSIPRYLVVEDCGRMINPAVVDGQVAGGVAQGLAGVLYERHHYDADGQLLTGTFADYLVPSAAELPAVEIDHLESPPLHETDWRGVGEGGTIGAPAALTNAIADAVAHLGVRIDEQHLPPARIRELLIAASPALSTPARTASG